MLEKQFVKTIKRLASPLVVAIVMGLVFALLMSGPMPKKATAIQQEGDPRSYRQSLATLHQRLRCVTLISRLGYNKNPALLRLRKRALCNMDQIRLEHFRTLLNEELRKHTDKVREDQATALAAIDDSVKDTGDMSVQDVNQDTALRMGERESQMVADIDQALLRIDEGTFGVCQNCGKPIDERRLESVPTARYDAQCQTAIEDSEGMATNLTM